MYPIMVDPCDSPSDLCGWAIGWWWVTNLTGRMVGTGNTFAIGGGALYSTGSTCQDFFCAWAKAVFQFGISLL